MKREKLMKQEKLSSVHTPLEESGEMFIDYRENILSKLAEWVANPIQYENWDKWYAYYNFTLTPEVFFTQVYKKLPVMEDMEYSETPSYHITNSPANRSPTPPSAEKLSPFRVRIQYGIECISGKADMNQFPVSLINNRNVPDPQYFWLLLKDRGNLSYLANKYDEGILTADEWLNILGDYKIPDFAAVKKRVTKGGKFSKGKEILMLDSRFNKIIAEMRKKARAWKIECPDTLHSIKEIMSIPEKKVCKTFLVNDAPDRTVFESWWYAPIMSFACRYEAYDEHIKEMQMLNSVEEGWHEFNFLSSYLLMKAHMNTDDYNLENVANIHELCVNSTVCTGEGKFMQKIAHRKQDGFQSWQPILAAAYEDTSDKDFISAVCRSTVTNDKRLRWIQLFKLDGTRGTQYAFQKVRDVVALWEMIDKLPEYEMLINTFNTESKQDHLKDITNVQHCNPQRQDICHIIARIIMELTKDHYKKDHRRINKRTLVAKPFLKLLDDEMKNNGLEVFDDASLSTTTQARYDHFFEPVKKKCSAELSKRLADGKISYDHAEAMEEALGALYVLGTRPSDRVLPLWDIHRSNGTTTLRKFDFNFDEIGNMHQCHLIPDGGRTTDNMFPHFPTMNTTVVGTEPIQDIYQFLEESSEMTEELFNEMLPTLMEDDNALLDAKFRLLNVQAYNKAVAVTFGRRNS